MYTTQKTFAKRNLVKYYTQIDRENMQEFITYLVHHLTGSWRYTEYNWNKVIDHQVISET